ncbi:MAG TPA: MBL fold metallo-hydrolase [Nitriliruptorales bacterium]
MPGYDRLDRRTFVTQLSRSAFGFVILGAATACAGDDEPTGEPPAGLRPGGPTPLATGRWRTVDLGFVAAYVLVRGSEAVVVDAGTEGSENAILSVLQDAGTGWSGVSEVILTHHHPDHVGSVPAVLEAAPGARAYAGELDIPAITSPRELSALTGGEVVSGLEIVATPGHTAGHISVLDRDARVLVAGDALNGDGSGGLEGPNPDFTQDVDRAWESVAALAALDVAVEAILPGHGGTVTADAASKLRGLSQERA